MEVFTYLGHEVSISLETVIKRQKPTSRYWFSIDGRPVTYTANKEKTERIARNYVELLHDEYHQVSRQLLQVGKC